MPLMRNNYILHAVLFLLTVVTTMMAGAELVTGRLYMMQELSWTDVGKGWLFSLAFLSFLTAHEFGHYFAAVYHKVKCSLPYYLPVFMPFMPMNIGSFGAVIRIREVPDSRRKYFDIGVAGPLAGFVVSILLLVIGFATLPPAGDVVYPLHPQYVPKFGGMPTVHQAAELFGGVVVIGSNLMFELFANFWPLEEGYMPPNFELMHYPLLMAGFLTLFFTALNLLPIGQFDGGHVVYGLFGAKVAGIVSRITVLVLLIVGATGVMKIPTEIPTREEGLIEFLIWQIVTTLIYLWLLHKVALRMSKRVNKLQAWAAAIVFATLQMIACLIFPQIEVMGVGLAYAFMATVMVGYDHPKALDDRPLSFGQKILGLLALLIFVLCFTMNPIDIVMP